MATSQDDDEERIEEHIEDSARWKAIPKIHISMQQSKQDQINNTHRIFNTHGNCLVLNEREYELYSDFVDQGKKGPKDEHDSMYEKLLLSFYPLIDELLEPYVYEPLPSPSHIRLLRLPPIEEDGLARCSVEAYDLNDDTGSMPQYECLSYTWGNPHSNTRAANFFAEREDAHQEDQMWPIQCDGRLARIRRNLLDALQQLPADSIYEKASEVAELDESENKLCKEQMEVVMSQLDNLNTSTHEENVGQTALMVAASKDFALLSRLLVKVEPAEADLKDKAGNTASDYATKNGHTTLSDFLTQAGSTTSSGRLLWIDALCINQQDLEERSSQVQLMEKIYTRAENVLVWLGAGDPLTISGLNALQKLTQSAFDGELVRSKIVPFAPYDQAEAFEEAGIPSLSQMEWAGLASIYQRQYFRRIWSLQEAVLAKNVQAYIGQFEIQWDALLWISHELRRMEKYHGRSFSRTFRPYYGTPVEHEAEYIWKCRMRRTLDDASEEKRKSWFEESNNTFHRGEGKLCRLSLEETMYSTATLNCFDPRDRVYGLLGIAGNHPDSPTIIPDYRKPISEVWAQVARHTINEHAGIKGQRSLEALAYMTDTSLSQIAGLPSWVPDYGFVGYNTLESSCFDACLGNEHVPNAADAWNQLSTRGIQIDAVKSVARARDLSHDITKYDFDLSWFELALQMEAKYHTGQPRTEVLWRTLCADQVYVGLHGHGHGSSPAPERYGKQFTELVCAMLVSVQERRAAAEGRRSILDPVSMGIHQAMSRMPVSNVDVPQTEDMADRFFNSDLIMLLMVDPAISQAMNVLYKFSDDETCFAPGAVEIAAYIRSPTFELVQTGPHNEMGGASLNPRGLASGGEEGDRGFYQRFSAIYPRRRLYLTEKGYLGLGPATVQTGDQVWVLAGSKMPVILRGGRDDDESGGASTQRLVGPTYLHGFMRGEAVVDAGDDKFETVVIE